MKKTIQEVLKHFAGHFPDNPQLLDMMQKDVVDRNGEIQPARGLALNTAYYMDGGTHGRPHHGRRFDERLSSAEKDLLGKEAVDLSELASMLYHPAYILDPSSDSTISEDRKTAREMLKYIVEMYQEYAAEKAMEELVGPMYEMLTDEVFDESKALNALLPHVMTEDTDHDPQDYKKQLMSHFLIPPAHGNILGHWEDFLGQLTQGDRQ